MRDPANARRARAETATARRAVIAQLAEQDTGPSWGRARRIYQRMPRDIRPSFRTVRSVLHDFFAQSLHSQGECT